MRIYINRSQVEANKALPPDQRPGIIGVCLTPDDPKNAMCFHNVVIPGIGTIRYDNENPITLPDGKTASVWIDIAPGVCLTGFVHVGRPDALPIAYKMRSGDSSFDVGC